jgi:hypothetical protein
MRRTVISGANADGVEGYVHSSINQAQIGGAESADCPGRKVTDRVKTDRRGKKPGVTTGIPAFPSLVPLLG